MDRLIAKILSRTELLSTNGHSGQRTGARPGSSYVTTRAELAPCTCPDFLRTRPRERLNRA